MVEPVLFVILAVTAFVSFWASLMEATYLTVKPLSLYSASKDGKKGADVALRITKEKTKLVSVTTAIDTASNVILASTTGLILSGYFGPIGWVISAIIGSLSIMTFLYLFPKAIGIENPVRMAIALAPSSRAIVETLSPIATPLTSFSTRLSEQLMGRETQGGQDLVDEFEDFVDILEEGGHLEPDAGRLIRSTITSSRLKAGDISTPLEKVVYVSTEDSVMIALKDMGFSHHPRLPVYDRKKRRFVGAVTFRSMSRAIAQERLNDPVAVYMIDSAKVKADDTLAGVIEDMEKAATTIAFVYEGDRVIGVITLTDILESLIGVKIR